MQQISQAGGAPGGAPSRRAKLPPIPGNKTSWFRQPQRQGDWAGFHAATGRLPNVTPSEQAAYMGIFAQEGGMATAPGGTATAGILEKTLNGLINNGRVSGINSNTPPKQLTMDQAAQVYRGYFDDVLERVDKTKKGHQVLQQIGDPKSAAAFADTLFRHGGPDGTEMIQNAINSVKPGTFGKPDRKMGPVTFGEYNRLAGDPKTRGRLLQALAAIRLTGKNVDLAEKPRFDQFR